MLDRGCSAGISGRVLRRLSSIWKYGFVGRGSSSYLAHCTGNASGGTVTGVAIVVVAGECHFSGRSVVASYHWIALAGSHCCVTDGSSDMAER